MKLHLPKALFVAVLACVVAGGSAFAATTKTTTYSDDVTYNGEIWTWNNNTNATAMSAATNTYTNYTDPAITYNGGQAVAGEVDKFYFYFYGAETNYTGNTLRFAGYDGDRSLRSDYGNVILGGIITETGNSGTYTYGRVSGNEMSNFYLNGGHDVNMNIGSSFTLKANNGTRNDGYIEVQKSGTWNVGEGATLTLMAGNGTKINANQTVVLAGEGSTVFDGKLTLAGNLTNGGTATISTLQLEGGSLVNNGTLNLNNTAITATNAALSNQHMVDYTGATSTTGGFSASTINVLTNGESATLTGSGTLSYGGQTFTIDSDHTSVDVVNYSSYTLNSGKVDMGAAAEMATQAGVSAPTALSLQTTADKEVDLDGFTTALVVTANGGTTTFKNADDASVDIKLTHNSAKAIFDGGTQTIGKLQSSAVSQGFEVTNGTILNATEVGTGGWSMSTQTVNGVLNISGNYEQRVNNTPLLTGTGSVVVGGSYVLGNITRSTISVANFTAASTNIENGTATITGGCVADLGNVTGTTDSNNHNLIVSNATLTHTGESAATVADNLNVTLGNVTIAGAGYDFAGNVKLTGTITNTATTLGLQGTLSADALEVFTPGEDVSYSNTETGNGYMNGSYVVVKGVNAGTTVAADTLTVGETSYALQKGDNITIVMTGIGDGTYFINNDDVYGSDAAMTAADTTSISLNGGKLTINEGTTVSKTIRATQTGSVVLSSGAELAKTQVSASADAKVMLDGEGTYVLNSNGLGTGVALGEDWTGAVRLSGVSVNNINLAPLANENSVVEMNGFTGWTDAWYGENSQNIKLTDTATGVAWSNGAFSSDSSHTCTFSGDWSGTGTFKTTGAPNGTRWIGYTFSGDVSEWEGAFVKGSSADVSTTLTFTNKATEVNASISHDNGNLHVVADADTTFNSSVKATDVTVNAGKEVTFNDEFTATTVDLTSGSTTTFNGATTIGTLTIGETAALAGTGAMTITTGVTAVSPVDLTINTLTLNAGTTVQLGEDHTGQLTTSALTINSNANSELHINADLVIAEGGSVTFNGGTVTLGCSVTFGEGSTVALGTAYLDELAANGKVLLFTDVESYSDNLESIVVTGNFASGHLFAESYTAAGGATKFNIYATPEPATATLSLLALAGLAARRRRR